MITRLTENRKSGFAYAVEMTESASGPVAARASLLRSIDNTNHLDPIGHFMAAVISNRYGK